MLETGTKFELNGDTRLHGRIESRSGVRLAGWVTALSTVAAGALVMTYGRQRECVAADFCHDRYPYVLPGLGILLVGGGLGIYMALQPDRARIDIR